MSAYVRRPIRARNSWLVRPYPHRNEIIAGLMLHSTRSGQTSGDDGPRTEGWWNNPNNIVSDQPPWGSYADILLFEDGTQVICTDWDREHAAWTAGYGNAGTWPAGHHYIQIEIAQGNTLDPFTPEQIDSLAQLTAELAERYQFPIERIPFLSQTGTPPRGICTHEASANGRKSGKTDVGPMFPWVQFLAAAAAYMEEDAVTREEYDALMARVKRIEDDLYYGVMGYALPVINQKQAVIAARLADHMAASAGLAHS